MDKVLHQMEHALGSLEAAQRAMARGDQETFLQLLELGTIWAADALDGLVQL